MTQPAIHLDGVDKRFGEVQALQGVSLEVPAGCIYGFIGPNGAGKTTAIRLLFGLLTADRGRVQVLGRDLPDHRSGIIGSQIGGIIEEPVFYPFLSGLQNLQAFAAALPGKPDYNALLEMVGLADAKHRKIKGYSLGMKQRLGLARAMLGDPQILILDEPTNGLDPEGIIAFRHLIRRMTQEEGRTVFVSSHLLGELEQTCDQVAVINQGKIVAQGTVQSLTQNNSLLRIQSAPGMADKLAEFGLGQIQEQADGFYLCSIDDSGVADLASLNYRLVQAGIPISHFALQRQSLEESFLHLLGGDGGA